jgi:hypothetical protein
MRVGQRLNQDRIDSAENGGAGANPESQRENADDGETQVAAQLSCCIVKIGGDGSDCVLPSVCPHLFAHDDHIAEFETRSTLRRFGREPSCLSRRNRLFEVLLHLVRRVFIGSGAMDELAEAVRELTPERHA